MKDFVTGNCIALGPAQEKGIIPEYVKVASVIEPGDVAELQNTAFADKVNRLLPIHTKAAAWMSHLYYYGHMEANPSIRESLDKAAAFYGITADVEKIPEALPYATKKASSDHENFALVVDMGEQGMLPYYPIDSRESLTKSASEACRSYFDGRLPIEFFRTVCLNITEKAAQLKLPASAIPDLVRRNGNDLDLDYTGVSRSVELRKAAGVSPEAIETYTSISDSLGAGEITEKQGAELWNGLDRNLNLNNTPRIPTFYETFHPSFAEAKLNVEKAASEYVIISGAPIPSNVVSSLSMEKLALYFGDGNLPVVEKIVKLASSDPCKATNLASGLSEDKAKTLLRLAVRWAS